MSEVIKNHNYKMKKKCSQCGVTSNNVERSKKFNILLCLDCLLQKILDQK
jgi:hypothetical protein